MYFQIKIMTQEFFCFSQIRASKFWSDIFSQRRNLLAKQNFLTVILYKSKDNSIIHCTIKVLLMQQLFHNNVSFIFIGGSTRQ